jgi:hypothetical protein
MWEPKYGPPRPVTGIALRFFTLYYHPVDSNHQHRAAADVSHLISAPPGFPRPSSWHSLKQN